MLFFVSVSDEEDETSAANGGHRLPRSLGEPLTPPHKTSAKLPFYSHQYILEDIFLYLRCECIVNA